jgi:hypothetical protein
VLDNDVTAVSNAPNCIEIAADHAVLNLKGHALQGNGTGIGVLIRQSANHAVLQGGDESSSPGASNRLNGLLYEPASPQAKVFQWNIGVEDDADHAMIELFSRIGGGTFSRDQGNNIGLFLNGAHGTVATDFDASYNLAAGVIARNSAGLALSNFSATGTNAGTNIQPIGVWFDSTNDSTISTASMAGNHVYGLWLSRGSSGNVVLDANGTSGNQDTGILIGCGNLHCTANQRSMNNRITNSGAPGNTNFGIVIERHSSNNIITVTHNDGNGNTDMVDENSHCDSNVWYNNTGTSNQSCIH